METLQAIAKRRSTRKFGPEKVPKKALDTILAAGCAAAVGHGRFDTLHYTVVQDPAVLKALSEAAAEFLHAKHDPLYGAGTFVVVSAKAQPESPGAEFMNASCMIENMLLAATDAGVDSCFILCVALAYRARPQELAQLLQLPEGYVAVAGAALGYAAQKSEAVRELALKVDVNYI